MTDDQLADAWCAGERCSGGIGHHQHLRIAWVVIGRHGGAKAEQRLVVATQRACEVHGVPETFDEAFDPARAIADLIERDRPDASAAALVIAHPGLGRSERFRPSGPWARA